MLAPRITTPNATGCLLALFLAFAGCQGNVPAPEPQTPAATESSKPAVDQPIRVEAPSPAPEGMVWIPGGQFTMGTNNPKFPDESPAHEVIVDGFWMDAHEVTNRQYREFVEATGYVTMAEKPPKAEDIAAQLPGVDPASIPLENLVPGSICYNPKFDPKTLRKDHPLWPYQVWKYEKGANWRHPDGPDSSIDDRLDHPVVHIAWEDAVAYCKWRGGRLPTEAEWEYAARGGREGEEFPWGNERNPEGKWLHNIWQGEFPITNRNEDGHAQTSPAGAFPPNVYGLYDMSGNVWEWCYDWYRPDYYRDSPTRNPLGPADSLDPLEPTIPKKVQRGGSFMCSDNYCIGYRVAARMKGDLQTGTFHCGFRMVKTPPRETARDE